MFAVGIFFTYFADNGYRSTNIFIYDNIFRDTTQTSDRCIEIRTEDGAVNGNGGYNTPIVKYGPFYVFNNDFRAYVHQAININAQLNASVPSFIQNNLFVDFGAGTGVNVESNQFVSGSVFNYNQTNNLLWHVRQSWCDKCSSLALSMAMGARPASGGRERANWRGQQLGKFL